MTKHWPERVSIRDIHWELLEAIRGFMQKYGYAPSIREMMRLTGLRSTSHVNYLLEDLQEKGFIQRTQGIPRSIVLITKDPDQLSGAAGQGRLVSSTDTPIIQES
jgi:repressor LexA